MEGRGGCCPVLRGRVWGAAGFTSKGIFVLVLAQFYRLLASSGASPLPHALFSFFCVQHARYKHPPNWSL